MEKGFCVTSTGKDQNTGVVKVNAIDGNTGTAQSECLQACQAKKGATGCEVIWSQSNRGCYIHTQPIAKGNGVNRHSCWVFPQTSPPPTPATIATSLVGTKKVTATSKEDDLTSIKADIKAEARTLDKQMQEGKEDANRHYLRGSDETKPWVQRPGTHSLQFLRQIKADDTMLSKAGVALVQPLPARAASDGEY